jgi:hypothetical protein
VDCRPSPIPWRTARSRRKKSYVTELISSRSCGESRHSQDWLGMSTKCHIRTFSTGEVRGIKNVVRLCIERLQQRHCLYEIGRVEAFGEQAVDRRQDATGFGSATLLTEQAGEADCGA